MHRVRRSQLRLMDHLVRGDHLVHLRMPRIGNVDDMDARRPQSGDHEESPLVPRVAMATAARVPAEMMELVPDKGHRQPVNHLRVRRGRGVDVDGREVIRFLPSRSDVRRGDECNLLPVGLHCLPRGRISGRSAARRHCSQTTGG